MMWCWAKQPDERPRFSDIVTTISKYTEIIVCYQLDINFNPFKSTDILTHDSTNNPNIQDSTDNERDEHLEKQLDSQKMLIPLARLKLKECIGQGKQCQ